MPRKVIIHRGEEPLEKAAEDPAVDEVDQEEASEEESTAEYDKRFIWEPGQIEVIKP